MKLIHDQPGRVFANALLVIQACMALALLAAVSLAEGLEFPRVAQVPEPLPLPMTSTENQDGIPNGCTPIKDAPLSTLTTDIQPRNIEGQVISGDKLPVDCAENVFTDRRYMAMDLSCDSCRPRWCDVLGFAHFSHHPLYFEEVCLERCGVRCCCCQPLASAACFYGGAVLMPARVFCVCPCSCVPAQYGCR